MISMPTMPYLILFSTRNVALHVSRAGQESKQSGLQNGYETGPRSRGLALTENSGPEMLTGWHAEKVLFLNHVEVGTKQCMQ